MELSIIINEKVKPEDINNEGEFMSITWPQLLPAINDSIKLRTDEQLDYFIANENGLKIKISRKKGRKNK